MIMLDEIDVMNMAYAEGWDDGQRGDNYNPYDFTTHPDEWEKLESQADARRVISK